MDDDLDLGEDAWGYIFSPEDTAAEALALAAYREAEETASEISDQDEDFMWGDIPSVLNLSSFFDVLISTNLVCFSLKLTLWSTCFHPEKF